MAIAGHVSRRMLERYIQVRIKAKRSAMDAWRWSTKTAGYDTTVIGEFGGPGRDRTDDLFHAMEFVKPYLIDGKDLNSRMSRQKPPKPACFATKMLPKCVLPICYQTHLGEGLTAGEQPFLIQ